MSVRIPRWIKRVGLALVGVAAFRLVLEQVTNLIAIYRPKRLHRALRRLARLFNRVWVWAVDRFDIDRNSEYVVVYHMGRKSGREYATPLYALRCDEGFIIGNVFGPTADWLRNLQETPRARIRYRGEYHDVAAEVISIDEAHRLLGGLSTCGWEQVHTEQCVLLRPIPEAANQSEESDTATATETAKTA